MENITLLAILFFSHYLVDYTALGNTIEINGSKYLTALIHSWIHSIILALILFGYSILISELKTYKILNAMLIQLFSHFLIDASVGIINHFWSKAETKSNQTLILGYDQFMHSLFLIIIYQNLIN